MIRALLAPLLVLAFAACSSGGGTTEESPPTLLPPAEFTAETNGLSTKLKWKVDSKSVKPDRFRLFRDGEEIMNLSGKTTEFEDPDLAPGKEYRYELQAERGERHSDRAGAEVAMAALTLADARLDGYYDVDTKVTSSSGFDRLLKKDNYGWDFTPKCKKGPCDARWHWVAHGTSATRFTHRGATYTTKWRGPFDIHCGNIETTTDVAIKIKVTAARAIEGEWVATRIKGTLKTYDPPQLGCTESRRTERFVGRLN